MFVNVLYFVLFLVASAIVGIADALIGPLQPPAGVYIGLLSLLLLHVIHRRKQRREGANDGR